MVVLDALVVTTALPRMQRDLNIGFSSLETAFPPEKRRMIVGVYGGLAGLAGGASRRTA